MKEQLEENYGDILTKEQIKEFLDLNSKIGEIFQKVFLNYTDAEKIQARQCH